MIRKIVKSNGPNSIERADFPINDAMIEIYASFLIIKNPIPLIYFNKNYLLFKCVKGFFTLLL